MKNNLVYENSCILNNKKRVTASNTSTETVISPLQIIHDHLKYFAIIKLLIQEH